MNIVAHDASWLASKYLRVMSPRTLQTHSDFCDATQIVPRPSVLETSRRSGTCVPRGRIASHLWRAVNSRDFRRFIVVCYKPTTW